MSLFIHQQFSSIPCKGFPGIYRRPLCSQFAHNLGRELVSYSRPFKYMGIAFISFMEYYIEVMN
jgi:hypothetical protein